jgi:hypothetical protein
LEQIGAARLRDPNVLPTAIQGTVRQGTPSEHAEHPPAAGAGGAL